MLKLAENSKIKEINVLDMKDGDIGIITSWTFPSLIGRIVQRYRYSLIVLGCYSSRGWSDYFRIADRDSRNRVRLLTPGETLIVE